MGDEGAAEKVYEAGLELVNPGGSPDVLRDAATAWRHLGTHLDKFAVAMDGKIRATHGSGWRGPAADAFMDHWRDVKKSIEDSQDIFTDAAKGLEKAADNIEKVNEEIHQIYIEIGVTVAAAAVTSFVTLGFSAAAGAANAARLAAQASAAAARLGRLLSAIARIFEALSGVGRTAKAAKFAVQFGIEYGANVGTSLASGKGAEWDKNVINAGMGMAGGAAAGRMLGGMSEGATKSMSQGALGGALGSLGGDSVNNAFPGEHYDASQMLLGAAGGAVGGGAGGALNHGALERFGPSAPDASATPNTPGGGSPQSDSRSHFSDAADTGLGKPAGLFIGEQTNDVKDEDEGKAPDPQATLHGDPAGKTADEKAGTIAGDQQTARAVRGHAGNTTLQEDFG